MIGRVYSLQTLPVRLCPSLWLRLSRGSEIKVFCFPRQYGRMGCSTSTPILPSISQLLRSVTCAHSTPAPSPMSQPPVQPTSANPSSALPPTSLPLRPGTAVSASHVLKGMGKYVGISKGLWMSLKWVREWCAYTSNCSTTATISHALT